jgi:predicted flap endonuclease-1-like 5' DNA nuclease
MSSAIWWLVLGLLLGWLIEWVIDWVYWRRRRENAVDTSGVRQAGAERTQLRDALASAQADNKRLQSELQAANELAQRRQGDIDSLNSRLAEAGDHDQFQAELNAATALAQQRQARIDELEERLARMQADDEEFQAGPEARRPPTVPGAGARGTTSPNLATIQLSREDMASFTPPADQPAADGPDTNDAQRLQEREVPQPDTRRRDPLIDINGIGPVYERKLFDAGVYTFEDLAALTPEQVRTIIAPQRWQEIDAASWIAEARQFAQKKA